MIRNDRSVVVALVLASCRAPTDPPKQGATAAASVAKTPAHAPSAEALRATAPASSKPDSTEYALQSASIVELAMAEGQTKNPGLFDVRLNATGLPFDARGHARIASNDSPVAYRRRLAFHRLAQELGMRVVPVCVVRRFDVGELAGLANGEARALGWLRTHARVENDGTVAALLSAVSSEGTDSPWWLRPGTAVDPKASVEAVIWAAWARAETPSAAENSRILRDFVEMMALDYLAANALRRSVFVVRDEPAALVLFDNENAFPIHPNAAGQTTYLRKLRTFARFPRALRDGLERFDRARARAALAGGNFDDWLLSPRGLIELDERRASLLSLIEAKIQERGENAVLSL